MIRQKNKKVKSLGPSARGAYKAFGLLKASLTEPMRQEMQQSAGCYITCEKLFTNRVSKPSISFLTFLP
jgi:hypothetical protein